MKDKLEIHNEAQKYARARKAFGDHTDLIQGYEDGYMAGYNARKEETSNEES